MANNYIPNGTLSILIADGGLTQATATPTQVSAANVNTCLETQSTTRSDIFMKPKTDAQIAAIVNPTPGMVVFSSDLNKAVVREATAWAPINGVTGTLYTSVNLTTAQIQGMSAAPVVILAAPGAGLTYIVHGCKLSITYATALFTAGANSDINLQYGATALAAGQDASNPIASTFLTATSASKFVYVTGFDSTTIPSASATNQSLTITNLVGPFAAGGTSTGKVEVWYSIV